MCRHCTRREFIGASAAIGGIALAGAGWAAEDQLLSPGLSPRTEVKVPICVIVAGKPSGVSWGLPVAEHDRIMKRLAQAEKNLGNVRFITGQATNPEQAAQLLEEAGPDAPVLAISADIFGLSNYDGKDSVIDTIFKQKRAVAVFHMPVIGGHDWCMINPWREEGNRITLFNSTDYDELERAASLLRVIPLLRRSRVLTSAPFKGTAEAYTPEMVKQKLGVEMLGIPDGRYDEVMANVDEVTARREAKLWLNEAEGILEPGENDVLKAARAGLTLDHLIAENNIDGLCIGTCMGWLERGFPCLGFSRLNDRGIPAACDGDMDSLLTMLIFQHALGQAGFLGNAGGVDTARNVFHLSHCSAPLKMDGPDGPKAPYLLRRHGEVQGGAVTEVHYRVGQEVTFTKLVHLDTLLMFTGKIVEAPAVPRGEQRGCRTELVAEVNDANRLLANWGGGALGANLKDFYASLHRVAYYGDHTQSIRHLGHLMGLKVVEEG